MSDYLVVKDISTVKQMFRDKFPKYDVRILIGEKQTHHIFVALGHTKDGSFIIEIPDTLKGLQDEIKKSIYAVSLKSRTEMMNFKKQLSIPLGVTSVG